MMMMIPLLVTRKIEGGSFFQILAELERPIVFSLSPGKYATPGMAKNIKNLVNMYRITSDDWDLWTHVEEHFDVARYAPSSSLLGSLSGDFL